MRNPNGPSIEEKEQWAEYYADLNEVWRNQLCTKCHLARKIVVHSDTALDEFHQFVPDEQEPEGDYVGIARNGPNS